MSRTWAALEGISARQSDRTQSACYSERACTVSIMILRHHLPMLPTHLCYVNPHNFRKHRLTIRMWFKSSTLSAHGEHKKFGTKWSHLNKGLSRIPEARGNRTLKRRTRRSKRRGVSHCLPHAFTPFQFYTALRRKKRPYTSSLRFFLSFFFSSDGCSESIITSSASLRGKT